MADEPGSGSRQRSGDYRAARIGAAAALVLVVVILATADVLSPDYDLDPVVLMAILGTIGALLGIEISNNLRGDGR
jgi:hypothetical protein